MKALSDNENRCASSTCDSVMPDKTQSYLGHGFLVKDNELFIIITVCINCYLVFYISPILSINLPLKEWVFT